MLTKRTIIKILVFISMSLCFFVARFLGLHVFYGKEKQPKRIRAVNERGNQDQRSAGLVFNKMPFFTSNERFTSLPPTRSVFRTSEEKKETQAFEKISTVVSKAKLKSSSRNAEGPVDIYPTSNNNFSAYGDVNCTVNTDDWAVFAKLFKKWMELAAKERIQYFLTCGSLLGSYRNGEPIPHDSDMDVMVNRSDFEKIKKHRAKRKFSGNQEDVLLYVNKDFYQPFSKRRRFTCRGKLVPLYQDHCSFQEPLGRLIAENHHIDIYDYQQNGESLWDPSEGGRTFDVKEVFPLRTCYFMSFETKCPNMPRQFLQKIYGKDLSPHKICINGVWLKKQ